MSEPKPIQFNAGQQSGIEELQGGNGLFINAIVDQTGKGIRVRPGVQAWSSFPASFPSAHPVVSMALLGTKIFYVTEDKSDLLNPIRRVYMWDSNSLTAMLVSIDTTTTCIAGTLKPVMVAVRNAVYVAGGGAPQKIAIGGVSSRLGGSPPNFNDLVYSGQFLIGSLTDGSGQFAFAGPGEDAFETWDTSVDFREAEFLPDDLTALSTYSRELWAFGERTLQGYIPDEQDVWAPAFDQEVGISVRRSILTHELGKSWWDHNRRVVLCNGHTVTPDSWISSPAMDETFEKLTTVSDGWGCRIKVGGQDLLVWSFPTIGRTFAYDVFSQTWGEWYTRIDGEWAPFGMYSHLWWPEQKLNLIGLADGSIAVLTFDATDDRGTSIDWVARTGFISHGRPADPQVARFTCKGLGMLSVRWRDGGASSRWRGPVRRNVTVARAVARVEPAGEPYDLRQWEISSNASSITKVTEAVEEVTLLEP